MLSIVQTWFSAGANPVGVSFGSDCLRLAQVERINGDFKLIAAASAEIPIAVRNDPAARFIYFTETVRDLWARGNFRGRRAMLCVPAADMHVQHMRFPRMDDESITKALPWESRGKLPLDSQDALLRHLVAGEVYHDQKPCNEIILMAAARDTVEHLLAAAVKARLDVVGMNVEPKALLDCFLNVYRRKADANVTNCFVDIGWRATRVMIARCGKVLFLRSIPFGGEQFTAAVAKRLGISMEQAKVLRLLVSEEIERQERNRRDVASVMESQHADFSVAPKDRNTGETCSSNIAAGVSAAHELSSAMQNQHQRAAIQDALREPLARLVEDLSLCHHYHEGTFPNYPVERLVFVGGEARNKTLCLGIAQELGIAAQIGDPLVRMGRTTEVPIESGIDRRLPQPAWSVAIGLSMGPPAVAASDASHGKPLSSPDVERKRSDDAVPRVA